MPSRHSKKVNNKIEVLCAQGCTQVNQLLEDAKKGKNITELAKFNNSESKQIIDELTQIMSIYDIKSNNNTA
jgi:hypothetical protein